MLEVYKTWVATLPLWSQIFLLYLLGVNILTFLFFGWDKFAAIRNARRTPERKLWLLTAIGGSIGALFGMELFKHKRRKVSFFSVVVLAFLIHATLVILYVL